MHEVDLPSAYGSPNWSGALAAPTLGDIDGDPDLEVILNTAQSGFVEYDLPGTAKAEVLWGTGRGNYSRNGSLMRGSLQNSEKRVNRRTVVPGDTLTYSILLQNSGELLPSVAVTDTLPIAVQYAGNLWAASGAYQKTEGIIT